MAAKSFSGAAASTTLASGIASGTTSIPVADGSTYPTANFNIVIDKGLVGEEKVLITSRSGNTLTAGTRGADGTSAAAHSSGATVQHCGFASDFQDANDHMNAAATVHAASTVAPTALIIPTATSPAQTVDGSAVWDSDDNLLTVGDGASRKTMADTSSTQTLAGKTLTTPTIADFTNAQHAHDSAAHGGAFTPVSHGVRVQNSSDQTTSAGGALSPVLWNTENFDTDAYHSTVSNTGRLTVPSGLDGYYLIHAMVAVQDSATAPDLDVEIRLNGTTVLIASYDLLHDVAGGAVYVPLSTVYHLAATDYVSVHIQITPGAAKSVYGTGSGIQASFGMSLLGT
jgi:hypothetical protein